MGGAGVRMDWEQDGLGAEQLSDHLSVLVAELRAENLFTSI